MGYSSQLDLAPNLICVSCSLKKAHKARLYTSNAKKEWNKVILKNQPKNAAAATEQRGGQI